MCKFCRTRDHQGPGDRWPSPCDHLRPSAMICDDLRWETPTDRDGNMDLV